MFPGRFRRAGRGVQREPQQAVADGAVTHPVSERRSGRQMRTEQRSRLVPGRRCRHTPPPGALRGRALLPGVPGDGEPVKTSRSRGEGRTAPRGTRRSPGRQDPGSFTRRTRPLARAEHAEGPPSCEVRAFLVAVLTGFAVFDRGSAARRGLRSVGAGKRKARTSRGTGLLCCGPDGI